MNKIIYCLVGAVTLFVIGACAHNQPQARSAGHYQPLTHTPVTTDHFRINMRSGYSANYPPLPTPFPPDTEWYDVLNWQHFLATHGYSCTIDDMFGPGTTNATKSFQASTLCGVLPLTGVVNQATYDKAVCRGMTPYPTVLGTKLTRHRR